MDTTFTKRLKSFLWRAAGMAVVGFISYLTGHLSDLGLSTAITAVLGLVLGEVTKWLNTVVTQRGLVN